jgi:hypothetical protein
MFQFKGIWMGFDIHTGKLIDLDIDVDAIFKENHKIYKIADLTIY